MDRIQLRVFGLGESEGEKKTKVKVLGTESKCDECRTETWFYWTLYL